MQQWARVRACGDLRAMAQSRRFILSAIRRHQEVFTWREQLSGLEWVIRTLEAEMFVD